MNELVFFEGGGFTVTERLLRTPRKTFALAQVEYVSVQRPLLLFAGLPAAGLIGFALLFRRYLLAEEIGVLVGMSALAILAAFLFGTLRVHSLALRDQELGTSYGLIVRLRRVRGAIEQAMAYRAGRGIAR